MRAEDLTIGNWVYSSFSYKPCRVLGIKILTEDYADVNVEGVEGWKDINSLTPIPLTPEILKKNGFKEYDGLYRLDIAEGVFINVDFKSKEPFVSIHNTCYRAIPIYKYVHQLQHALRLCGIEKEIIL